MERRGLQGLPESSLPVNGVKSRVRADGRVQGPGHPLKVLAKTACSFRVPLQAFTAPPCPTPQPAPLPSLCESFSRLLCLLNSHIATPTPAAVTPSTRRSFSPGDGKGLTDPSSPVLPLPPTPLPVAVLIEIAGDCFMLALKARPAPPGPSPRC